MSPELAATSTFDEVFRAHAPTVWRALRRLGVREADIEDQSQEVFVVVHRKLREFEGRSKISTWIYGICVRVAADYRKRAHVRREQPGELPEQGQSAPQHRELEQARARALLDAALAGLDDEKRAVFVLYEIEELTMAEVAQAVGIPLQTAYSRLYAGRKAMTETLSAQGGGS
jgi:RNA polymerase sigma-70 factor, ECF subfamily